MNKKKPGSYFPVMNITGNVKGKLVNMQAAEDKGTSNEKGRRLLTTWEQYYCKNVYTLWFCPRIKLVAKGRFSETPCLSSWKEGVN